MIALGSKHHGLDLNPCQHRLVVVFLFQLLGVGVLQEERSDDEVEEEETSNEDENDEEDRLHGRINQFWPIVTFGHI